MDKCEDCFQPKPDVKEYILHVPRSFVVKLCQRCYNTKYRGKAEPTVKYDK